MKLNNGTFDNLEIYLLHVIYVSVKEIFLCKKLYRVRDWRLEFTEIGDETQVVWSKAKADHLKLCLFYKTPKNTVKSFHYQVFRKARNIGYMLSNASYISDRTFAPVNTTFPDTNISKTIFGFTIRYINLGNNSGS